MQVHHVFGEAGDELVGGLLEFLFDVVLEEELYIVRPVVGVGSLPATDGHDLLPVIIDLLDLLHDLGRLPVAQVREKLLDVRKLLDWHLVVELLVVRTVILIILWYDLFFAFFIRGAISHLFLLLVLIKLKLAA